MRPAAYLVLQLILLTSTYATALPTSLEYLQTHCAGHRRVYAPLIANQLSPYRTVEGLSVDDVLKLKGAPASALQRPAAAAPQILIIDGVAMTKELPVFNMEANWAPLLNKITNRTLLPDLVIATNIYDEPKDDTVQGGGPWFGYCNHMFQTTNLMLPASAGVTSHLRCNRSCEPFTELDTRQAKAVFLGSSTGWLAGRRRAAVLAGILHNDTVQSGFTQMIDLLDYKLPEKEDMLSQLVPHMELAEQVSKYKYIINADGHCAALRMRQLLASDSAVFWVESNQIEWFYPLLQPFVHYIPVRYVDYEQDDPLHDVVSKVHWAEQNPKKVAAIVRNANKFAAAHLTDHGILCYSTQLLDRYARLFSDAHTLKDAAQQGNFSTDHIQHWLSDLR